MRHNRLNLGVGFGPVFKVVPYTLHGCGLLDASDPRDRAAALIIRFDIALELASEALGPRHGGPALGGGLGLATAPNRDAHSSAMRIMS